MFARWRKLAAAAGAFCFPLALAHASPQFDNHTSIAPCVRNHQADESVWFRNESNNWYQRYYGDTLDDAAPANDITTGEMPQLNPPVFSPNVIIADIEAINESEDQLTIDDSTNECNSIDCPCHDILNESTGTDEELELDQVTPTSDIESPLSDANSPYNSPIANASGSSKSQPTATLKGCIEFIVEDTEQESFDEPYCGDNESDSFNTTNGQGYNPDADDSDIHQNNDFEPFDNFEDTFKTDDLRDMNDGRSKFHMFYPGCDWSPYYPASNNAEPPSTTLPEDVRSA
jgi:hypothetical protein